MTWVVWDNFCNSYNESRGDCVEAKIEDMQIVKTIETELGMIHILPATKKATEQDLIELHDLLAKLYIKRQMRKQKATD